jgi:gamma-glutamyltranspeptidase/glutathione hydrolase
MGAMTMPGRLDDGAWRATAAGRRRPGEGVDALGASGMVASAHPRAAVVGAAVLARGGNAFDAAIAVAAAEGVLLPMMCGLGGDAFVVLYDARHQELVALNGSGVAAAGATRDRYASQGLRAMPLEGVHSVAVPGALALYETLWTRWGSLPWEELWAPAIELAEDGVVITEWVSHRIAERAELLRRWAPSARMFLPGGRPPAPGDRWRAPDLARSLRAVAAGGAETFYRGALAERLLACLREAGAPFEPADFARQLDETFVYRPLATEYRGATVHETGPVSQGFLLLAQLNLLEGFDLGSLPLLGPDRLHLMVEAKKLAFADRNRYAGDPAFVSWPLERLISKRHADRQRAAIDPARARGPEGALVPEHAADTTYFAVVDRDGNAVSFIHSLSAAFGSGVVAGDTGITLNNRAGRGFTLEEGHPNVIAPGKRTMHTLNAYLVTREGRPWLVGGTPGGDQQTQWNAQVITAIIDHGLSPAEAVEAPRWFSFPGTDPATLAQPLVVRVEDRVPEATRRELARRGHALEVLPAWGGGGAVQLIQVDRARGILRGASDPRTGGLALGL